jgi:hypothetical protein
VGESTRVCEKDDQIGRNRKEKSRYLCASEREHLKQERKKEISPEKKNGKNK